MNTEKLEKLKKSLDNKFIPDNMKEKIRAEIQKLETDIKKDESITATEVKEEVKEIEQKVEQALEVAEQKEEKLEAKKPTRVKRTTAPKSKAKTVRKTTTAKKTKSTSSTSKKSIYTIAKEIRKPNEAWKDAVKRAGANMRGESKEVSKKVSSELEKLKAFVKRRKELKGISETNLVSDSKRKGLPPGKRVSPDGNVYYEYRDSMSDRLAPNYPKNAPYLAGGGGVDGKETIELKTFNRDGKVVNSGKFEFDFNNETVKFPSGKTYKIVPDREYTIKLQKTQIKANRGIIGLMEFFKEINQPDSPFHRSYTNTLIDLGKDETFEVGGYMTDPTFGSFQSGVYAGGGGVDKISFEDWLKNKNIDVYKRTYYWVADDGGGDYLYSGTKAEVMKSLREDWKSKKYELGGSVDLNDVKVKAYKGFHGLKAENYFENVNGYDWNVVTMKRYGGDLVSSARGGKSNKSDGYEMFTFDWDSPSIKLVSSRPSRVTEKVIEEQHKLALQTFKDKMESENFADGGYNEGIEEDIDLTDDNQLKINEGVQPKNRASMKDWMGKTNESREAMAYELGGATMQYDLAGHTSGGTAGLNSNMPLSGVSGTHYTGLVGETGALSSGEMFARGGGVGKIKVGQLLTLKRDMIVAYDHSKKSEKINKGEKLEVVSISPNNPEFLRLKKVDGSINNIGARVEDFEMFAHGGGVHGYVIVEGFDSFKNRPLYQVVDKSDDTDYVGEYHTTRKEAEEELKDLVEGYARGGSTDRKYLNHSEDYEVRYAKGKNRHGYGNLKFAGGGKVGEGFTIKQMKDKLDEMFPDSFGFEVNKIDEKGNKMVNAGALIQNFDKYGGLTDKDINSLLFFPQYNTDHNIRFRIYQGQENTYFSFILYTEDGQELIGGFGFKDEGDVSSDYITRFIAFLMEQYGLPFQVNHSVMARGGSTDRKYLNHSEDYEVRYAKGKNRHGYGNLKFADGGAVMANQQIIADASQQYVNYYLGEGASAGMFADGGAIKNQYKGRSPMDIWNNLTREQKSHFLHDHQDEIAEVKNFRKLTKNEISQGYSSDWIGLDDDFKNAFAEHISKGQYAIGGMMPKVSKRKHRNE